MRFWITLYQCFHLEQKNEYFDGFVLCHCSSFQFNVQLKIHRVRTSFFRDVFNPKLGNAFHLASVAPTAEQFQQMLFQYEMLLIFYRKQVVQPSGDGEFRENILLVQPGIWLFSIHCRKEHRSKLRFTSALQTTRYQMILTQTTVSVQSALQKTHFQFLYC